MIANTKKYPGIGLIAGSALFSAVVLATAPFIGGFLIMPGDLIAGDEAISKIFWQIRVPRVLLAWAAGAGLALSGAVFQAMFRNPLATPFTLGVASGASLGAALFFRFGASLTAVGLGGSIGSAFAGAFGTIFLVYFLSGAARSGGTAALLLCGVVINFFLSSLVLFIQYLGDFSEVFSITRWLMGSLTTIGFHSAAVVGLAVLAGFLTALWHARSLNLLAAGDEIALTRGVNIRRLQFILYAAISLVVAAIVATCGVISFVGIIVPYICRVVVGAHHPKLLPASLVLGGAFLVICDSCARTIISPSELPVGIITALLGGPFFLWILTTRRVDAGQLS